MFVGCVLVCFFPFALILVSFCLLVKIDDHDYIPGDCRGEVLRGDTFAGMTILTGESGGATGES